MKLNKIDLDQIGVPKIDFATCSIFKLYYETDMEEVLLRIRIGNIYGEFKHWVMNELKIRDIFDKIERKIEK